MQKCKLSNGSCRYRAIKLLLPARERVVGKFRVTNQHPNLPWKFFTHGFLDPPAFPHRFIIIILVDHLVATIHFSPFTCCFRGFVRRSFTGFFTTRTLNSQNHSYVHYSLSRFTGEWFTNHSRLIMCFV